MAFTKCVPCAPLELWHLCRAQQRAPCAHCPGGTTEAYHSFLTCQPERAVRVRENYPQDGVGAGDMK